MKRREEEASFKKTGTFKLNEEKDENNKKMLERNFDEVNLN